MNASLPAEWDPDNPCVGHTGKYCDFCMCTHTWKAESLKPRPYTRPTEFEFVAEIPKEAGDLVGTCVFNGKLIVACQYGIFQLIDGVLVQIKFK